MTRVSLLIALLCTLATWAWAQDIRFATFQRLEITDTPVGLATATLDPVGLGQIQACEGRLETAQVRYRFDGGTVSAATGILFEVGDVLPLSGHATASALRFAKTGSTSGMFQVTCWRR